MTNKKITFAILLALVVNSLVFPKAVSAQSANSSKTNSKMIYHNGPVMLNAVHVYFVYYGCWSCGTPGSNLNEQLVLADFASSLGLSPYFRINTTYPDFNGLSPNGAVVYAGAVTDSSYSLGNELTESNIKTLLATMFLNGLLPQDPAGIYVVLASSDVGSNSTGFCTPSTAPLHGNVTFQGTTAKYAFIGNAARCPAAAAPQFVAPNGSLLPTPNNTLAGDAMVSSMAHVMNALVSNPNGNAWFDRYGLENADKCRGTFGTVYATSNGAKANVKLGARDFLIQQNWVNDRHGYCGLSNP